MKEKILDAFAELGFKLDQIDETCYGFSYEGAKYLSLFSDDDEDFLSISIPGIYDFEEKSPFTFIELTNKINATLKYVKAYHSEKSIWLFYERELMENDDLRTIISHMILHLDAAHTSSRKLLAEIKSSADEENGDNE